MPQIALLGHRRYTKQLFGDDHLTEFWWSTILIPAEVLPMLDNDNEKSLINNSHQSPEAIQESN